MSAGDGADQAFERLKALLVGDLTRRFEGLEPRVDKIDSLVGDPKKLEAATAEVLVDALKVAEVERHRDLANVLAPLVVSAIRAEIKNSKEMMIEALYPITGRLVTAAVAGAFRDLVDSMNRRIDALVSADVWRLRLRALMTGRSLAEVALAEADAGRLKRALLLERGSGVVLASWPSASPQENADLTSGLIAAITEFATAVYADSGGELRNLDLGSTQVFLRASARVIVAGEFTGELTGGREKRLDEAFLALVEAHEKDEASIDGEAMGARLEGALADAPAKAVSKTPIKVVALIAAGLAIWFSIGPVTHAWRERRIRKAFDAAMADHPALADFPLRLDIDHAAERVTLRGLASEEKEPLAVLEAIAPWARPYKAGRDVKIVVIAPRAGETLADGEKAGERLAALDNEMRGANEALGELRDAALAKLRRRIDTFAIFFTDMDAVMNLPVVAGRLDEVAALLKSSGAGLRVVGYADEVGGAGANRMVSRKRAEKIAAMLTERGVPKEKLAIVPRAALDPISDQGQQSARSRRVVFELPYEREFDMR